MPLHVEVKSLQDLCYIKISSILFDLCKTNVLTANNENKSSVINYFRTHLPKQILLFISEYLTNLCEKSWSHIWMTESYLGLMEGLKSEKLLLGQMEPVMKQLKMYNGSNVKELKLKGSHYMIISINDDSSYTEEEQNRLCHLYTYLESFNNLTVFRSSQMCDDHMLHIFANNCPNLEELHIELSAQISNKGISMLCGLLRIDERGEYKWRYNISEDRAYSLCCKKLKKVYLEFTMVSVSGGVKLLQSCPNLEVIDIIPDVNIGEVFYSLHGRDKDSLEKVQKRYALKKLNAYTVVDYSYFDIITYTCPYLEDVSLRCMGMERNDKNLLANLLNLPLKKLALMDCNMIPLLWLLEKIGKGLESLSIQHLVTAPSTLHFDRTHLQQIIKFCPNLTHFTLRLQGSTYISPDVPYTSFGSNMNFFTSLTGLKIEGALMSEQDLVIFINKCKKLRHLHLACAGLEVIDDAFLYNLLANGLLQELEILYLFRPMLTMAGLRRLISNCPKLHTVGPISTWVIPKKELDELRSDIKKNNWNLDMNGDEMMDIL